MISVVWHALAAFVLYRFYVIVYNLFFHPLRKVPGPPLYAVSWIPKTWRDSVLGKHWSDLVKLHEKYGNIVRIGPDAVSCASGKSWTDIVGFKTSGRHEFIRDPNYLDVLQMGSGTFLSPEKQQHRQFRKIIGVGLSEKAMLSQEPVMVEWGNKFIANLHSAADKPVDIALTFIWATLDVMGDLTFSEPFDCLETSTSPAWLDLMQVGQDALSIFHVLIRFDVLTVFYRVAMRLPIMQSWIQSLKLGKQKADKRLERQDHERQDIMSLIWNDAQEEKAPVTREQVAQVSNILCLAGAESTATSCSGILWWLLTTPRAFDRLVKEIRTLENKEDLTPKTLASLPYFQCCIQEGLRMHSPITGMMPRVVPKGGDWVEGYFFPEGTICGTPHWASAHLARHFNEPTKYWPERWLPDAKQDERFANDDKDVTQPFGKGPMACIGKQLAMTEIRLLVGKLLWQFDVSLQPESESWVSHPNAVCRMFREKAPLMVTLAPVKR